MLQNLDALQAALNCRFTNIQLLMQALTHRSAEDGQIGHLRSYERLEFLGDSVLQLVVSLYLYQRYPDLPEGDMSRLRAGIVREGSLAGVARGLKLGSYLVLGHGEQRSGGADKPSILADVTEAIFGAVYLEFGWETAQQLIIRLLADLLETPPEQYTLDAKTLLQEKTQSAFSRGVAYRIVREEGPDHEKRFTAQALLDDKVLGQGEGTSKKAAEQEAARMALRNLNENG